MEVPILQLLMMNYLNKLGEMSIYFSLLLIFPLLVSCGKNLTTDTSIEYSVAVEGVSNNQLLVYTIISRDDSIDYPLRRDYVLKQELFFINRKDTVAAITFYDRSTGSGKFDNKIEDVTFISNTKDGFYRIAAWGGCNSCPEYLGYFSTSGLLLCSFESSVQNNLHEEKGNFSSIINKYHIDRNDEYQGKIVLPYSARGNIQKVRLNGY